MAKPSERLLACPIPDREGNSKDKIMGAVVQADGKWVFYKRLVMKRDVLRIRGVWGIDKRVLDLLVAEGVEEIHCFDDEAKVVYSAPVGLVAEKGEVLTLATTQVYLPIDRWDTTIKPYKTRRPARTEVLA